MSGIPIWESNPRLWDVISIGGIVLPCISVPTGGIGRKVDTVPIDGDDSGGTKTDLGYEGAVVTVKLKFWLQEHLDLYAQLVKRFRPRKGEGAPQPVDVIHPALALMEIRAVTINRMGIPEPGGEKGIYEASIEFLEFISDVKKGKKDGEAEVLGGGKSGGIFGNLEDAPYANKDYIEGDNGPTTAPGPAVATPPPAAAPVIVPGPQLPVAPPVNIAPKPSLFNPVPLPGGL